MKPIRFALLFTILFGLVISLRAASFNISSSSALGERNQSLSLTTNDVVLIKTTSGAVALIQFTHFDPSPLSDSQSATYRWRYRSESSLFIQSGKGQVRESYNRTPAADGKGVNVTPKADHDPIVRAGDVWVEWSYHGASAGWLYYNPARATVQVLGADAFDKDL